MIRYKGSSEVSLMSQDKLFGWPVAVFLFVAAKPLMAGKSSPKKYRDPGAKKHARKQRAAGARRPAKVRVKARNRCVLPGTQHK